MTNTFSVPDIAAGPAGHDRAVVVRNPASESPAARRPARHEARR